MKCASCALLASLVCSCVAHDEGDDVGEAADSYRLRFLDRSDPFVEHTFEIMEVRALYSEIREHLRAQGERVCEEGENETHWRENCNTCWCYWGMVACTKAGCHSPEIAARIRAEMRDYNRRQAEQYRELREKDRARGVRVCEEGEDGTVWKEDPNTCWCKSGIRYCDEFGPPPPPHQADPPDEKFSFWQPPRDYRELYRSMSRRFCEEDLIGTYWLESCNACWCEAGIRVCSKADCPERVSESERDDAEVPMRRPFLDPSDPLVEHAFEIMKIRADRSEMREQHRAEGRRVCEEGEDGTRWREECNTCWCEWGVRRCTPGGCPEDEYYDEEYVVPTAHIRPCDYREIFRLGRCKEDQKETSWQEGCNTCWCEAGFRVCSKADCP